MDKIKVTRVKSRDAKARARSVTRRAAMEEESSRANGKSSGAAPSPRPVGFYSKKHFPLTNHVAFIYCKWNYMNALNDLIGTRDLDDISSHFAHVLSSSWFPFSR